MQLLDNNRIQMMIKALYSLLAPRNTACHIIFTLELFNLFTKVDKTQTLLEKALISIQVFFLFHNCYLHEKILGMSGVFTCDGHCFTSLKVLILPIYKVALISFLESRKPFSK